jgi:hypothetical protein
MIECWLNPESYLPIFLLDMGFLIQGEMSLPDNIHDFLFLH